MFVFLSPQSADSTWIHFEAGCAYAKEVQVVPVCLPGIDLNRITPPLSLLQGFNLHTHDALGNLARICNETFDMKMNETFSGEDFDNIISKTMGRSGFFGRQAWAIDAIKVNTNGDCTSDDFNPIPALHELCNRAGMNCNSATAGSLHEGIKAQLEQPGCGIEFVNYEIQERSSQLGRSHEVIRTGRRAYHI